MCGRYSLTRRQTELIERFGIEQLIIESQQLEPRYNIAPSQLVPVIIERDGKRILTEMKWGLIPFWAKEMNPQKAVINARVESVAEKPYFKQAASKRRCLIPADGFYEWRQIGKQKQPLFIHAADGQAFAFAGLWDEWRGPGGEQQLRTCTILTREANDKMRSVHSRMPVILRREHEKLWLSDSITNVEQLSGVWDPIADDVLTMYAVSTAVNSAKFDDPTMIEPVPQQQSLFD